MWEDHVTKTFPRSTVPYILPIIIMPTWCRQHLGPLPLVYPQSSLFCWPLWALYPYGNGDTREDFLNHSNHLITGVSTITRCICTVIYIYICIEFMSRRVFFTNISLLFGSSPGLMLISLPSPTPQPMVQAIYPARSGSMAAYGSMDR